MGAEALQASRRSAVAAGANHPVARSAGVRIVGEKPARLHYTGPFVHSEQRPAIEFPWERLDGRPLIYASMGTLQDRFGSHLQNDRGGLCRTRRTISDFAGWRTSIRQGWGSWPADPLVVSYAPQLEILKRAALVITHAGLNTVLESLSEGCADGGRAPRPRPTRSGGAGQGARSVRGGSTAQANAVQASSKQ